MSVEPNSCLKLDYQSYLDTLALWQRDPGLVLPNDEDVRQSSSKSVVDSILDMDNVKTSVVALTVGDDTNTSHITTTGDHGNASSIESDVLGDLTSLKVDLDGVVDLDGGIWVADTTASCQFCTWVHFIAEEHTSGHRE